MQKKCFRFGRSPARVLVSMLWLSAGCSDDESSSTRSDIDAAPLSCADEQQSDACHVCIEQGALAGAATGRSCQYLGIPFAEPPVGELRFAAPEPASGWTGVREAKTFGAACLQGPEFGDVSGTDTLSEDCLFLNVWTPQSAPARPLPVMVFVHGGGYVAGATNAYSGLALSEKGPVVVVTMNYRLGALGFFAHPDLDAQRPDKPSGADGIRDQQLALRWVKDNIGAFRGDPSRVTLFGESAGSSSVGVHIVSPGSRDLVSRFILESGVTTRGVANGLYPATRTVAYAHTERMAAEFCPGATDVIACLRGLPADSVTMWRPSGAPTMATEPGLSWVPVVEGPGGVLPDTPDALMERGDYNHGALIVGTNKSEYGGLFESLAGGASSLDEMRARVRTQFGEQQVDEIMSLYAPEPSSDAKQAYIALMSDVLFRCAARQFARTAAPETRLVYLYSFEEGTAYHADELLYVFGQGNFALQPTSPVPSLSAVIQQYWLNFAASGDPNGEGLPTWPKYQTETDQHLTLAVPPTVGRDLQKAQCDFWDAYLASRP